MADLIKIKEMASGIISSHTGQESSAFVTVTEPRPWVVNIKYDDGSKGMSVEVFVGDIKPVDIEKAAIAPALRPLIKTLPRAEKCAQESSPEAPKKRGRKPKAAQ